MSELRKISTCHKNWDSLKVPLKINGDGGDCLHRLSLQAIEWYLNCQKPEFKHLAPLAQKVFEEQLRAHFIGNGNFRRYWRPSKVDGIEQNWFCKDDVFSRDQSIPLIIALGLWEKTRWVEEIERGLRSRQKGGICFYPNTRHNNPNVKKKKAVGDIVTPQIWGLIDKAKGMHDTGSIKNGDLAELADSMALCAQKKAGELSHPKIWHPFKNKFVYPRGKYEFRHGDPVNKTMILLYNKIIGESGNAKKARHIYCDLGSPYHWWLAYWLRPSDPQCPFHVAFASYVIGLREDSM